MSVFRFALIVLAAFSIAGCDTESGSIASTETGSSNPTDPLNAIAKEGMEQLKQASANLPEMSKLLDPATTVPQLKQLLSALNVDQLKKIATQFMEKIQGQEGIAKGLQEKLDKLGALGSVGELKKQLENSTGLIDTLKEKLGAIVSSLKDKGADVTQFTNFLEK